MLFVFGSLHSQADDGGGCLDSGGGEGNDSNPGDNPNPGGELVDACANPLGSSPRSGIIPSLIRCCISIFSPKFSFTFFAKQPSLPSPTTIVFCIK